VVKISSHQLTGKFVDQGYNNGAIPFSKELASLIQIEVMKAFETSSPHLYLVPNKYHCLFGNELKRFIVALYSYNISPNPLIPLNVLINGISDKDFAIKLKKTKMASLTRSFHMEAVSYDGLDQYAILGMKDIGDIFNYRYWFRWEEPEPEDWKYALIDLPKIDPDIIEEFEDTLWAMLPPTIPIVQPDEILLSSSSSASRLPDGRSSSVWKDKSDPKLNTFSSDPLVGYRTLVYKCPTEYRDCISLSVSQSNTIKLIERQCAELCRKLKYSAYGYPETQWEGVATRFRSKCEWFLNRDLTKEGWTKPRWILQSIGRVLKKKYPKIPAFDYFGIFDDFTLVLETGERVYTKRGHGLGMANALTTIMQCVVFQQILDISNFDIIGTLDALFYNDDGTIGALREESIDSYSNAEDSLLESFGLLRKDTKTYKGKVSIFLEDYWPVPINEKTSYWNYVKRIPFASTNIVSAKDSYYLICDTVYGEPDPNLFRDLITLFGYEYSSEEVFLPWWAGGWWRPKYKFVDCSFYAIPELDQTFARGFSVGPIKPKPLSFYREKGVYRSPISALYNTKNLCSYAYALYDIDQPMSKISAKYHRQLDSKTVYNWWTNQYIQRQIKWRTPAKPYSLIEYYTKVIDDYPSIDFVPPIDFIVQKPMSWATRSFNRDFPIPVEQPNKLLGALAFWAGGEYIKYVVPNLWVPGIEFTYHINEFQKQNNFWDHWIEHHHQLGLIPMSVDHNIVIPNIVYTRYDYLNPYHVVEAFQSITGLYTYPAPLYQGEMVNILKGWEGYRINLDVFSNPWRWSVWTSIGRTIVILDYMEPFTPEVWKEILQTGDECEEPAPVPTDTPPPQGISEDYVDFWTWYGNSCRGRVHPALQGIYTTAADAVDVSNTIRSLMGLSANREYHGNLKGIPTEGSSLDILCKSLCHVDTTYINGVYLYRPPDLSETWGADGDDGGGAFGGLFD